MKAQLYKGVFVSGVLNILLGILHQVVLYFEYQKAAVFLTPETEGWITDFLLFSMAIGVVLLFMGAATCYGYYGLKNDERWAKVIAAGISLLLLVFAVGGIIIQGPGAFIIWVHLFNSLLIGIPLLANLKPVHTASRQYS